MAAPIKNSQNSQNNSGVFFACFCVAVLGSQMVVIYGLFNLNTEMNRLDHWMKHFKEELEALTSTLARVSSPVVTSKKAGAMKSVKDGLEKDSQVLLKGAFANFETQSINTTCNITDPEVLSAISRAKTDFCKKELERIVCLDKEGKLMPAKIPRYCPLRGNNEKGKYLGCFKDNSISRDVGSFVVTLKEENSPEKCVEICISGGYSCAALQFSVECWCGNFYGKYGPLPESSCSLSCPGNRSQSCGGYNAIRVFSTGLLELKRFRDVQLVQQPQEIMLKKPIRIVFALMVAGRAVRQVKRLIKAIHHPDHYIFIHVDKKAEYMYQELLPIEDILPNVRLTRDRVAVGWSGFSQMEAAYGMMKALVAMRDWTWDYFINLSECAYPIKSTETLAKFLTKYQGANFMKSHEAETFHFIDKQGLGFLFYECESHLWRLGLKQKLPTGIMYDGGSDWYGLHISFCRYAVLANDTLINGLMDWAKYSFAPLESFFHTLLMNSEFCDSQIDINLHMINWVRSEGCSCFKRNVDFCGCSPKNMKPKDFEAVLGHKEAPVFFTRKLEAAVNQEIFNLLDMNIGTVHKEDAKLTLYWQNFYNRYDPPGYDSDVKLAFGNSFVRHASKTFEENSNQCEYMDLQFLESHVLFEEEKFQSYIVKHSLSMPDETMCTYESRFIKIDRYKIEKTTASNGRLQALVVGSDYDPKERIFRNYAGLFGPETEVVLHHAWIYGPTRKVTFKWIDPRGNVAASHNIRIARTRLVQFHNPKLKGPLLPGVWTIKALVGKTQIAIVHFLIIPTQSRNDGLNKHRNTDDAIIDKLTSYFWTNQETCLVDSESKMCPALKFCKDTVWSSASPDAKSDIKRTQG